MLKTPCFQAYGAFVLLDGRLVLYNLQDEDS